MIAKRLFDLTLVVLAAPIIVLVLAVLAVLVRINLGSPVFFTQVRPGLHGRPFALIKFRTMTDARDDAAILLPDEKRLTRFGRFLRATSLDELPEIMNILAGDMSFVGPRPLLMEYLPLYTPRQAHRHDVLPGVTGWAQINGRNNVAWEDRFARDLWYVAHRSFWLDLSILVQTIVAVVSARGIAADNHATMPKFEGNGAKSGQSGPDPL